MRRSPRRPADALQRAARRALSPLIDWTGQDGRLLAKPVRRPRRSAEKGWTNDQCCRRNVACSVVVEREISHPPEKALACTHATTPDRGMADEERFRNRNWGTRFKFRADYLPGGALDCEVLAVEPNKMVSYSWGFDERQGGVQSDERGDLHAHAQHTQTRKHICAWSTPVFGRISRRRAYQGAKYGWPQFLGKLEQVLARTD